VRCTLKWGNERNPYRLLYHSAGTASVKRGRKEGTTSSPHSPYVLGYTHVTMDVNNGLQTREGEQILKSVLSWDCSLKPDYMNLDLLVIAGQHTAVNTFSGLVHTARQVSRVGGSRIPS
jgi:hypothetical protein